MPAEPSASTHLAVLVGACANLKLCLTQLKTQTGNKAVVVVVSKCSASVFSISVLLQWAITETCWNDLVSHASSLALHARLPKKRAHGRDALSSGICDIIFCDNNENDQSLLELKSRSLRKFMHQYFPLKEREVSPNADFVIKTAVNIEV